MWYQLPSKSNSSEQFFFPDLQSPNPEKFKFKTTWPRLDRCVTVACHWFVCLLFQCLVWLDGGTFLSQSDLVFNISFCLKYGKCALWPPCCSSAFIQFQCSNCRCWPRQFVRVYRLLVLIHFRSIVLFWCVVGSRLPQWSTLAQHKALTKAHSIRLVTIWHVTAVYQWVCSRWCCLDCSHL